MGVDDDADIRCPNAAFCRDGRAARCSRILSTVRAVENDAPGGDATGHDVPATRSGLEIQHRRSCITQERRYFNVFLAKNAYFDTMHPSDCWKGAFFYLESYRFLIEMGEGAI